MIGMKVLLFAGFLGSGKTTFLNALARELAKSSSCEFPVVAIENEQGETGYGNDGFKFPVELLAGGCICCTLSSGLGAMIKKIENTYCPEFVLIETSGMAMPGSIISLIEEYLPEVEQITTVVMYDTSKREEVYSGLDHFLRNQLQYADYLLLNKCDLITDDVTEEIAKELKALNARMRIIKTSVVNPYEALESISDTMLKQKKRIRFAIDLMKNYRQK